MALPVSADRFTASQTSPAALCHPDYLPGTDLYRQLFSGRDFDLSLKDKARGKVFDFLTEFYQRL
jgi:hypothetical protein